jgi:hypothetical protein
VSSQTKEWEDHTKGTWFFSDKKIFKYLAHHLERINYSIKMSYATNILPSRNCLANCFSDTNRTTKQNVLSVRAIKSKHLSKQIPLLLLSEELMITWNNHMLINNSQRYPCLISSLLIFFNDMVLFLLFVMKLSNITVTEVCESDIMSCLQAVLGKL